MDFEDRSDDVVVELDDDQSQRMRALLAIDAGNLALAFTYEALADCAETAAVNNQLDTVYTALQCIKLLTQFGVGQIKGSDE